MFKRLIAFLRAAIATDINREDLRRALRLSAITTLACLAYPTGIRSTGASWAMGAGRIGSIAGPLLGGMLLAVHLQPRSIFVAAFIPAMCVALLMVILGRLRHRRGLKDALDDRAF